ncbi:MAG: hypothetical protein KBF28_08335 [Gemmatimonadales bacterium]|nr:hypothetical protein [Gemmatimonadales bacterium]
MVMAPRVMAVLAAVGLLAGAEWHPVHAARIDILGIGHDVRATVLVYETDFPAGNRPEAIAAYLSRTLVLRDAADRVINLAPSQISSEGDRLRIALRGKAIEGLRNGRIAATLLHERFDDQVNVVEARIDGRRRTLVFLPGEASQGLP